MTLEKFVQFGIEEGLPDEKGKKIAGKIADGIRYETRKHFNGESIRKGKWILGLTAYAYAVLC